MLLQPDYIWTGMDVQRVGGSHCFGPHDIFTPRTLACAIHAANRADIQPDDVVVVSGCGPIGLGAVAAARRKNPKLLIALDLFDWKLAIAKQCGADVVLNPKNFSSADGGDPSAPAETPADNVIDYVKKTLTDGFGCDKYIEAAGHPGSVTQGLAMILRTHCLSHPLV